MDHYLHIKNTLANDNGRETANGGKAMEQVMNKIDKSFFTSDQRKYMMILKKVERTCGASVRMVINRTSGEHFAMMSEVIYELVKAFGAGQPVAMTIAPCIMKTLAAPCGE